MKKNDLFRACFNWLKEKEHLFFCLSCLTAIATVIFSPFYCGIFLTVLVMTLIIWFKLLEFSSEPFDDHFLAMGWALIAFSLAFGFAAHSVSIDEYGIRYYGLPILWAGLVSAAVYWIAPKISSRSGLSDEEAGFNNPIWILILYIIFSVLFGISETSDKAKIEEKIEWEQTQFEPVFSWEKEVWQDAGTVYLVTTKKGTFFVKPYHCPKIRKINKNTQVRVVFYPEVHNQGGARRPRKLEIRN